VVRERAAAIGVRPEKSGVRDVRPYGIRGRVARDVPDRAQQVERNKLKYGFEVCKKSR